MGVSFDSFVLIEGSGGLAWSACALRARLGSPPLGFCPFAQLGKLAGLTPEVLCGSLYRVL